MAKKKASRNKNKVQHPEEIAELAQRLNQLPDHDKGQVLRQANIPYLQSQWRPVFPTREILTLVNRTGRLAMLINLVMRLMATRRIAVEDLEVISEAKIRQNTVDPAIEMINAQISRIEEVLNKNQGRSGAASEDTAEREESADIGTADEPAKAEAN